MKFKLNLLKCFFALSLVLLGLALFPAMAKAEEITQSCTISVPGDALEKSYLFDRRLMTQWRTPGLKKATITVKLPDEVKDGGLYLLWGRIPGEWSVTREGEVLGRGDSNGFAHAYIPFKGGAELQIEMNLGKRQDMSIQEIYIFSGDQPPEWVERWEEPYDKADLLVLAAHPDDELIFMGGTIPYYAAVRGKKVQVCYMTCANERRRSELLQALWSLGIRHYPVIGPFPDKSNIRYNMNKLFDVWKREKAVGFLVRQLRRFKPDVVVTHDLKGEYGHSAHKACANAMREAVVAAAKSDRFPDSFKDYETWACSKLYLHLYPQKELYMDWLSPQEALKGKSPLQAAQEAFTSCYRSQSKKYSVKEKGRYDNARFGLAYSLVGDDVQKNDFFENIK